MKKLQNNDSQRNEKKYRSLFENSPISIWEEDFSEVYKYLTKLKKKGISDFKKYFKNNPEQVEKCAELVKILDVNKRTIELFHAESKEVLLTNLNEIFTKESQGSFIEQMLTITENGQHYKGECINKTIDGKLIDVALEWVVAEGFAVDYSVVFVSLLDITEQKRVDNANRHQQEQIKLINKILRHDLANNLTVISSSINNYLRSNNKQQLENVKKYIDKSSDLISKMKDHEFLLSTSNLKIYNIEENFKTILENFPMVKYSIVGKSKIFADESLNSVIDNLISNAVVHSKTTRIDIKITTSGKTTEVRIIDYGKGISDDNKKKIFEEGYKFGVTGHSGLGLYIVNKAITNWGGKIYVEDNEPKGTVFVMFLSKVN
ncbi:MAG: PAS domain-containing protein [Candidatus Cloacimonetes bacterium]|nr:PAS domain-containing protein [Candidatus Cloacimonadota bacterium]